MFCDYCNACTKRNNHIILLLERNDQALKELKDQMASLIIMLARREEDKIIMSIPLNCAQGEFGIIEE